MSNLNRPSLTDVQVAFTQWRQRGTPRRTPAALRAQAVSLLAEHRVRVVMAALRLDHRRLRRWRQELSASGSHFVELPATSLPEPAPAAPPMVALTLTRHAAEGGALSIAGELSPAQWRWALALLQEQGP